MHKLYSTGGFWKTSFNNGQVAFLCCLGELAAFAAKENPTMDPPHKCDADKGTIGGLSVKSGLGKQSKIRWTRAMKFLLTDLKWIVAWASKWDKCVS